jgi:hypothetical protein
MGVFMRLLSVTALCAFLVGCSGSSLEGQIVDGMTNQPRADVRLVARTTSKDAGLTCKTFEGTSDASGNFKIAGLCGGIPYEVKAVDETLWLAEFGGVPAEGLSDPQTLKAWRAPAGDGVYRMSGDKLTLLRTGGDVRTTIALNGGADLKYPSEIPKAVPVVSADDYLVMSGAEVIAKTNFYPLYKAFDAEVGTEDAPSKLTAWFAGVEFDADWAPTDVGSRTPNKDETAKTESGKRVVAYVKGSALPAHRYGAFKEGDRRMHVVDFGGEFTAPSRPAAP